MDPFGSESKFCKGILVIKSEEGIEINKVLVEARQSPHNSNTLQCRFHKFVDRTTTASKIPVASKSAKNSKTVKEAIVVQKKTYKVASRIPVYNNSKRRHGRDEVVLRVVSYNDILAKNSGSKSNDSDVTVYRTENLQFKSKTCCYDLMEEVKEEPIIRTHMERKKFSFSDYAKQNEISAIREIVRNIVTSAVNNSSKVESIDIQRKIAWKESAAKSQVPQDTEDQSEDVRALITSGLRRLKHDEPDLELDMGKIREFELLEESKSRESSVSEDSKGLAPALKEVTAEEIRRQLHKSESPTEIGPKTKRKKNKKSRGVSEGINKEELTSEEDQELDRVRSFEMLKDKLMKRLQEKENFNVLIDKRLADLAREESRTSSDDKTSKDTKLGPEGPPPKTEERKPKRRRVEIRTPEEELPPERPEEPEKRPLPKTPPVILSPPQPPEGQGNIPKKPEKRPPKAKGAPGIPPLPSEIPEKDKTPKKEPEERPLAKTSPVIPSPPQTPEGQDKIPKKPEKLPLKVKGAPGTPSLPSEIPKKDKTPEEEPEKRPLPKAKGAPGFPPLPSQIPEKDKTPKEEPEERPLPKTPPVTPSAPQQPEGQDNIPKKPEKRPPRAKGAPGTPPLPSQIPEEPNKPKAKVTPPAPSPPPQPPEGRDEVPGKEPEKRPLPKAKGAPTPSLPSGIPEEDKIPRKEPPKAREAEPEDHTLDLGVDQTTIELLVDTEGIHIKDDVTSEDESDSDMSSDDLGVHVINFEPDEPQGGGKTRRSNEFNHEACFPTSRSFPLTIRKRSKGAERVNLTLRAEEEMGDVDLAVDAQGIRLESVRTKIREKKANGDEIVFEKSYSVQTTARCCCRSNYLDMDVTTNLCQVGDLSVLAPQSESSSEDEFFDPESEDECSLDSIKPPSELLLS